MHRSKPRREIGDAGAGLVMMVVALNGQQSTVTFNCWSEPNNSTAHSKLFNSLALISSPAFPLVQPVCLNRRFDYGFLPAVLSMKIFKSLNKFRFKGHPNIPFLGFETDTEHRHLKSWLDAMF